MSDPGGAPPNGTGIVLVCEPTGEVTEVLRNDTDCPLSDRFLDCLAEASREKGRQFLAAAWTSGEATRWELLIGDAPSRVMLFAAFRRDHDLLVIGASSDTQMMNIVESMAELNSTLVTKLRQAIKDGRTTPYERFSELTNELANAHRTLWKQSQELKRLNEEKNRLLAMVTHDIRSPLTVVMNYARLLEQGLLDDDERSLAIQEVLESSKFILHLVDDLLDLTAIDAGKFRIVKQPANPVEQTRATVRRMRPLAREKQIGIELEADDDVADLMLDHHRFRQILENLIMNAIKFSPEGTTIDVAIRQRDERVEVSVADQGPGVSREKQKDLFEPFERVGEGEHPGSGLGLAIVRKLARIHSGDVAIESAPGKGARFIVTFPMES